MRQPRPVRLALALTCAACALAAGLAIAQEKAPEQTQQEMMQIYLQAARPGPEHARLARDAGRWDCTIRAWMDPAGEPAVSKGTEESEMILGGRFLASRFQGQMMGMPFEGFGLLGYDNVKKKHVGVWLDSMGSGMMSFEGDYDAQKKELVSRGEFIDAATGQPQQATMISREIDPDRHVFEMWSPAPDGQLVKWMEIEYQRAK